MNKKMLLAIVCALGLAGTALALNNEHREVLYALDQLGQDFSSVSMIDKENIDMFIGIFHMEIKIAESKLKNASSIQKKALRNAIAIPAIGGAVRILIEMLALKAKGIDVHTLKSAAGVLTNFMYFFNFYSFIASSSYYGYKLHDACKAKNELEESLARDKKILRKLQELKESLASSVTTGSAAKNLLNAK
jgi:hypothetical protein